MFKTHPHRQRELLKRLAVRLPTFKVNQHDMQSIRRAFAAEIESKGLVYVPLHNSAHFSEGLVDRIAGKIESDPGSLEQTKAKCKRGTAA